MAGGDLPLPRGKCGFEVAVCGAEEPEVANVVDLADIHGAGSAGTFKHRSSTEEADPSNGDISRRFSSGWSSLIEFIHAARPQMEPVLLDKISAGHRAPRCPAVPWKEGESLLANAPSPDDEPEACSGHQEGSTRLRHRGKGQGLEADQ